jgi:enoyl-CoA hydratase/carnithine racemase
VSDLVSVDKKDGVADVRLNRPDKYNSLSTEMWAAVGEAGENLKSDTSLRAVVLSGNGPGFCAGLDTSTFGAVAGGGKLPGVEGSPLAPQAGRNTNFFQHAAHVWRELPVPVIAAVHGVAYGAGFQIAMGADIRVAHPESRWSIMEIKWGLIPDVAITQTIRAVLREDVAKDLIFTGRVIGAEEAQSLGVVTRIAEDPLADALESARAIASRNPHAIRHGKQLIHEAWHAEPSEGLALEARLQRELLGSPNQIEAVKANMEKRTPNFSDPD